MKPPSLENFLSPRLAPKKRARTWGTCTCWERLWEDKPGSETGFEKPWGERPRPRLRGGPSEITMEADHEESREIIPTSCYAICATHGRFIGALAAL